MEISIDKITYGGVINFSKNSDVIKTSDSENMSSADSTNVTESDFKISIIDDNTTLNKVKPKIYKRVKVYKKKERKENNVPKIREALLDNINNNDINSDSNGSNNSDSDIIAESKNGKKKSKSKFLTFINKFPFLSLSKKDEEVRPAFPQGQTKIEAIPNTGITASNNKRALLIGINYFGTDAELNGCINDVINIKNFLHSEFKLLDSDIRILTDSPDTPLFLRPTKANILAGIKWLTSGIKSDAQLFLHYSGHGLQIKEQSVRNRDENDGFDEAICPSDYQSAGFILDDELKLIINNTLPLKAQLFSIFDCCHSGTILDLKYNYMYKQRDGKDIYELEIEKLQTVSKGKVILLSGALDSQTAADAFISGKSQGAMTYSFLMGYNTLKAQKIDITPQNLLKSLFEFVKAGNYTQNPKLSIGTYIPINSVIKIFN